MHTIEQKKHNTTQLDLLVALFCGFVVLHEDTKNTKELQTRLSFALLGWFSFVIKTRFRKCCSMAMLMGDSAADQQTRWDNGLKS
jgi:hypothetical protein